MKLDTRLGEVVILAALAVSLIPIWLAWGFPAAILALVAIAFSRRGGITERAGEVMYIFSIRGIALRIGVDLGIPIAGIYAAFRVWDPCSAGMMILIFVVGIVLSLIGLITQ